MVSMKFLTIYTHPRRPERTPKKAGGMNHVLRRTRGVYLVDEVVRRGVKGREMRHQDVLQSKEDDVERVWMASKVASVVYYRAIEMIY
ncbi:hypothetical protein IMSHALPRED_010376 [Imshaugia aleurites]|uniref:Uncharacterized protein n=1 Tax=Imshaugia aleurites TaxID=172621 RepID=A0A8H3IVX5_9LECA|nr:hypothetical protein IMSHALPRED_010376 [Imshaugia aleurites]